MYLDTIKTAELWQDLGIYGQLQRTRRFARCRAWTSEPRQGAHCTNFDISAPDDGNA